MKHALTVLLAALLILSAVSCGPRLSGQAMVDNYVKLAPYGRIRVEAYLFDARIYRQGKPTSVRLEMYRTDSMIALAGRGYLGKGALKGLITRDSVVIYFPSTNEYIRSGRNEFLSSASCTGGFERLHLENLLTNLPNEEQLAPAAMDGSVDNDRAEYSIIWPDCDWHLDLRYRERDHNWRIDRVDFDDGADIRFKAETRTIKTNTEVDRERFQVEIPVDAVPFNL
ncbi:MAG TPA: hypothetical protein PLF13_07735 [candidate division Zixibacteria bacterium]|nr:hypothetical protein [candidate division Zixibacteria bacterium]